MATGDFAELTLGAGLTGTDLGGGIIELSATASGAGLGDTHAWMPLTTVTGGVPEFVWDGDDQLIPTITAI